jgi:serine/threonine-protein kinase
MNTGSTPVTQIGKYQVLGVLGVGGMGTVYRGMDKSVGREVAIKTLTEGTEELRQRFQLEARSGVLNHPNIVTVYDFGEQDGNPYIVMEYVQGDSLENLLRGGRQFTLIEKLEMVRQACLGLGYAHQKGVVHRDIKPANLMIQPDGNVKIVDFGVARLQSQSGHTQTGMVIGTFHYISPERLLGRQADGRADIWSLGCILYLLLTGRLPFPGDDPATLHRVIREPHDALSTMLSGYPPALDHVIDRALAKDPDERYESGEEMAGDLEAINDDLKRDHVGDVLASVKPMMEREQWTSVRPVLLDLQRLNPQNTEVKKLLREVQEKVSRQQKSTQLRQLLSDAEEAVLQQRYAEALEFYKQADSLDRGNAELTQKLEHVRGLKEKADKVASLLEQAREARRRSDFGAASGFIDKALQLDERSTDLRNERARIVQEAEKATRERARREFSDAARQQLSARQYTEAIKSLRSALEIDPTDAETQQLYQGAVEQQEEQRRRKIIDQIVAEISESIADEDYPRALTLIQRALDKLPGEAVLMQLKVDAEAKQREKADMKLVEKTSLEVYNLFLTKPQEALVIVQQALEQVPGEPRLIALQEKVLEQLKKATAEQAKSQSLKQAQAAIDAKQFDQAVHVLEATAISYVDDPDITSMLKYAREQQRKADVSRAVASATKQAVPLIASGDFEAAIAVLQPVATQTRDASIEQLLRQATGGQTEYSRRVEAVLSRAQALSETSPDQAIQLLQSQPQDVQRHARVRELRTKLDAAKENEDQIRQAVQNAQIALQNRDLRNGLGLLETAQRAYGDTPLLKSAIAEYKAAREQIANEILSTAIAAATQAIQQNARPQAAEALERVADVAEFADGGLQAQVRRLAQEAGKPANQPPVTTALPVQPTEATPQYQPLDARKAFQGTQEDHGISGTQAFQSVEAPPPFVGVQSTQPFQNVQATQPFQNVASPQPFQAVQAQPVQAYPPVPVAPAKTKSGNSGLIVVVLILVLLLAVGGGAAYWFLLRPAPPVVAGGVLQLNATPYAEVMSITSDKGKAMALPTGDHWTPLRIDEIPAGQYSVVFRGPNGNTQSQQCAVDSTPQICSIEMKPIDDSALDGIIGGAK